MKNIVLIGFMGVGKSCIGKLLASKLSYQYVDTDKLVEKKHGMSIATIFAQYGEEQFRQWEQEVVAEVSESERTVISTGGGVPLRKKNMQLLRKKGFIVHLRAKAGTIFHRTASRHNRPLLQKDVHEIEKMLAWREQFYRHAHFSIYTDKLSPLQIVREIMFYWRRSKRAKKREEGKKGANYRC